MSKIYSVQSAASWINDNLPPGLDSKYDPTLLSHVLGGMIDYIDFETGDEDEFNFDELDHEAMLEYIVDEFLSGENDRGVTVQDLIVINQLDNKYQEQLG